MKITSIKIKDFMIFKELDLDFSAGVNVISGENNTGKTAIIKLLYSIAKSHSDQAIAQNQIKKSQLSELIENKLLGVFRPEYMAIGRLVNRNLNSQSATIDIKTNVGDTVFVFGANSEKRLNNRSNILLRNDIPILDKFDPIYIPPKEIISSTSNFVSLYNEYNIDFEETYYDLARLLARPLKRTINHNDILSSFSEIIDGDVIQKDSRFYLKVEGSGEFEMGLVSEGYRKLLTLMYLISTGSITKDSIIFWDEPETNMNPRMIEPLVRAIMELANLGAQIFITTHDYFVQQAFNMYANYPEKNTNNIDLNFISLYKEDGKIEVESARTIQDLNYNSVMAEFDALYEREQEMIYGRYQNNGRKSDILF